MNINPRADFVYRITALQLDGQLCISALIEHPNGRAMDGYASWSILIISQSFFYGGVVQGQDIVICVIVDIVVPRLRVTCACDSSIAVRRPVAGEDICTPPT